MKPFNKSHTIRAAAALNTVAVADMLVSPARAQTQKNRSPLRVRHAALASLALLVLHVFAPMGHGQEVMSFFGTVAQWQYPDSTLATNTAGYFGWMGDASMKTATGDVTVSAVQAQAVWTTKDPMEEVIAYYETRLKRAAGSKDAKSDEGAAADSATSVVSHDDSIGRPLGIHHILVNTETASTTLVISRAATESETHVAWVHYVRIRRPPTLEGKLLPDLTGLGVKATDVPADNPAVVLLIDAEQRSSRRALKVLTDQAGALKEQRVAVIILQGGPMDDAAYAAWLQEAALPFPIARLKDTSERGLSAWGATSLPWLLLAVQSHRVAAAGFLIEELEAKLKKLAR
jgi:hypothetical protein